jgi:hypothetical protein
MEPLVSRLRLWGILGMTWVVLMGMIVAFDAPDIAMIALPAVAVILGLWIWRSLVAVERYPAPVRDC